MHKFWKSMVFLTFGKFFGMTSPFILKWVVNTMMMMTSPGGPIGPETLPMMMATFPIALTTSIGAVGIWGLSKVLSTTFLCYQMDSITSLI